MPQVAQASAVADLCGFRNYSLIGSVPAQLTNPHRSATADARAIQGAPLGRYAGRSSDVHCEHFVALAGTALKQ